MSDLAETMHTPGPYCAVGPDEFGDYNILSLSPTHSGSILAVGAIVSNLRGPREVMANAELFAAAPAMLKALEALAGASRSYIEHMDAEDLQALEEARAAIAAAKRGV